MKAESEMRFTVEGPDEDYLHDLIRDVVAGAEAIPGVTVDGATYLPSDPEMRRKHMARLRGEAE